MSDHSLAYCDVALPVPVDRLFTYLVPVSLWEHLARGCRVTVPFGNRKLTGVVLRLHDERPTQENIKEVLALREAEPLLQEDLLQLGNWIAEYYCAPVGEVLRGMLPLSGETRRGTQYSLTSAGRDVLRQLSVEFQTDSSSRVLTLLESRDRSAHFLARQVPDSKRAIRALLKRGWIAALATEDERDPLRSKAERLRVSFKLRPDEKVRLKKGERELIAFLELHVGSHNLAQLESQLKGAGDAARSLARRKLVKVEAEDLSIASGYERPVRELNNHQREAFSKICRALEANRFESFLLHGVTGSGKTEVYLQSIERVLQLGKNALLLVPEIALTPAVAGQFFQRFGKQVAILHSAFGDTERAAQWRRIRNGGARVVVATRSGVFAPVQNLGLVIVDEEHDSSYKQAETPRYHGRDVAVVRSRNAGAVVVLGSATPSIETRYNAEEGKYQLLEIPERIGQRPLPQVEIVDMRVEFLETKQQATFSRLLTQQLKERLAQGEQSMLLMNRRGFASFMVCRACGERMQCENCSVTLTQHRRDRRMLCHYCGYAAKIPSQCPRCESEHIQFLGTGSERVEDELHQLLPGARIARLDRDAASKKGAYEEILSAFRDGQIDVLTGTQMIAKGHDIPNVTLVGVVLADIGLSVPDFRAAERTFQLLTQVAGRAGRGSLPGQVIVQTLNPEHYAIRFSAGHDYAGFYRKEIEFRKWLRYPPFAALANLIVRAEKQEEALQMATEIGFLLTPPPLAVRVLGPAEAPLLRLKSEYRYQILLKAAKRSVLREILVAVRSKFEQLKWKATALSIDVDPITLS